MRLDIIGSVASGKTTLAKRISQRFNTPYYEKDNVVWKRTSSGDEKEVTRKEIDVLMKLLIKRTGLWRVHQENLLRKALGVVTIL